MFRTLDVLCGGESTTAKQGVCGGMWDVKESSEEDSYSSDSQNSYTTGGSSKSDSDTYITNFEDETIQSEVSNRDDMAVTPLARMKANGKLEIMRKVAEDAMMLNSPVPPQPKFTLQDAKVPASVDNSGSFGSPGVKGAHGRNIEESERKIVLVDQSPQPPSPPAPPTPPVFSPPPPAAAPQLPVTQPLKEEEHPLKVQIATLLEEHEPARLPVLDKLMRKFKGKEDELLTRLNDRYKRQSTMLPTAPEAPLGALNLSYSHQPGQQQQASPFRPNHQTNQAAAGHRRENSNSNSTAPTDPTTDSSNRTQPGAGRSDNSTFTDGSMTQADTQAAAYMSSNIIPGQKHSLRNMSLLNEAQINPKVSEKPIPKAVRAQSYQQQFAPSPSSPSSSRNLTTSNRSKKSPTHRRALTSEIDGSPERSTHISRIVDDVKRDVSATDYKDPFVVKISKLVNYVYGETTKKEHDARIGTILKAYSGRELILLKLLETKREVKKDTDKKARKKGVPRHISYESEHESDDDDDDDNRNKSKKLTPRKGKTKSSNGDDDTISTISYGTANFQKRKNQSLKEKEDATSESKSARSDKRPGDTSTTSMSSSSKENNKQGKQGKEVKPSRSIFGSLRKSKKKEKEKEKVAEKDKLNVAKSKAKKISNDRGMDRSRGKSATPQTKRTRTTDTNGSGYIEC